jgi:phage shock protein C
MSDRMNNDSGHRDDSDGNRSSEFQDAVERLETAVQQLVNSAKDQFSDRATAFVDETTSRLRREFGARERTSSESSSARERMRERRRNRHRRSSTDMAQRSRRLYRDPSRQKIAGVCAGIGNYYGVETWVVRCVAVTGMLFLPSIVFPAYWIMYFVMGKPPKGAARDPNRGAHGDHYSPAPELGTRLSPRRSLRNAQVDLAEVELRLRRMESHVTSDQYELRRELNKIDGGEPAGNN